MDSIFNNYDKDTFASELKYLIKKNNIRQIDLALKLGVSKSAISNYLSGLSVPRTETLFKIAEIFDVELETLITKKSDSVTLNENSDLTTDEKPLCSVPLFKNKLIFSDIIYRNDNYVGTLTFPFMFYGDTECYAVKVSNNELKKKGVPERSVAIYALDVEAEDNELVAVYYEDDAKILIRSVSYNKDKITLSTDNESETYTKNSKNNKFKLLGKVVSVIRYLW